MNRKRREGGRSEGVLEVKDDTMVEGKEREYLLFPNQDPWLWKQPEEGDFIKEDAKFCSPL